MPLACASCFSIVLLICFPIIFQWFGLWPPYQWRSFSWRSRNLEDFLLGVLFKIAFLSPVWATQKISRSCASASCTVSAAMTLLVTRRDLSCWQILCVLQCFGFFLFYWAGLYKKCFFGFGRFFCFGLSFFFLLFYKIWGIYQDTASCKGSCHVRRQISIYTWIKCTFSCPIFFLGPL